ncbi:MAG TPA: tyrosine-type recombinase/integrase [Rariglobus sp.]
MTTKPRARRQYGTGSVTQLPNGKYLGRLEAGYTATGTRRRISVIADTEAECKRRLRDKRMELEKEGPGAITTTRPTVKAWSETWLAAHERSVRPKTYATDASVVRKWIVPTIGHRKLSDLTPGDVRRVTDAIRKAGRTSTTAGYAQAVLMRALKSAVLEGHRVPDRVLLVPKPAPAVSDRDALTIPHAIAVLRAAEDHLDGVRWACALLQGMRQGEVLGLTWDAIDLDAGLVDVSWQLQSLPYADKARGRFRVPDGYEVRRLEGAYHLTRPKSVKGVRVVPLIDEMVVALERWRAVAPDSPHGLVFPRLDGKPRNTVADRTAWHDLQATAHVAHPAGRPYLLHEARHTTATLLGEAGVDPEIIRAILGHSSIATQRSYRHGSMEQRRRALADVRQLLVPQIEA